MKVEILTEPDLQFGAGRHIDIRFGIMNCGPLDFDTSSAPKQIRLGIVGTPQTIEGCRSWLERCGKGIGAKVTRKPNLFPRFPGFGPDSPFRCSLVCDTKFERAVAEREFDKLASSANREQVVLGAATLFQAEIEYLAQNTAVDVIVCSLPLALVEVMEPRDGPDEEEADKQKQKEAEANSPTSDFHHLLKARVMRFRKPIQLILPMTYNEKLLRSQKRKPEKLRRLQDEATRAWNFHVALYYKANGIPWRLIRDPSELTTCFIGVSFYKSLEGDKLLTSVAQVFNERGEGMIVRGGYANVSKEDRQPHLDENASSDLLHKALQRYRDEHRTTPARVVIHKSSIHSTEELAGFERALREHKVEVFDLLSLAKSFTRLLRLGAYPTMRGTLLSLDPQVHLLYTRGSVEFYRTYPGMFVPRPLRFRRDRSDQTPVHLAKEILALTKMNWNNTQFDNSEPITLHAARQVGDILKYLQPSEEPEPRYGYYM